MKFYYSTKARESAIQSIEDLQKKIGDIPGNHLSYSDAVALTRYLGNLAEAIRKEDIIEKAQTSIKNLYSERTAVEASNAAKDYIRSALCGQISFNEAEMLNHYDDKLYMEYSTIEQKVAQREKAIIEIKAGIDLTYAAFNTFDRTEGILLEAVHSTAISYIRDNLQEEKIRPEDVPDLEAYEARLYNKYTENLTQD